MQTPRLWLLTRIPCTGSTTKQYNSECVWDIWQATQTYSYSFPTSSRYIRPFKWFLGTTYFQVGSKAHLVFTISKFFTNKHFLLSRLSFLLVYPHWHELSKQEKCSSLLTPSGIFLMSSAGCQINLTDVNLHHHQNSEFL